MAKNREKIDSRFPCRIFRHRPDTLTCALLAATLLYLTSQPLMLKVQAAIGFVLVALIHTLSKHPPWVLGGSPSRERFFRAFALAMGSFLTLRYIYWRATRTLPLHEDPASIVAGLLLFMAELYGITMYLLGNFVNISPLHRQPVPLPTNPAHLPQVDVLIPTYNEDPELLEITLIAATQLRYPRDRYRVYLLDDGATAEKRNDPDPARAQAARERRHRLRNLCHQAGATYLSRERNEHAKAGNINAALARIHGDLLLVLDSDHVPTEDILENTVGFFVRDPKLFLVQTPHTFITPDPIERNLNTFERMPGESEMFYRVVQHGLDFWNASFFCGSAAILRRRMLDEAGGVSGETITEDAETAIGLHGRGYRSVYLGSPMICGLQPESFNSFVSQRVRWAQGMVQIFLLKNPWRNRGLNLAQRLAYTNSTLFWFFPFARTLFLVVPSFYLLFGLHIYNATLAEVSAFALPHILGAVYVSNYLFGHTRWPFISELYETMQSIFSLAAIIKVFRNPRAPTFKVTPKGEKLDTDFLSSLAMPFYALFLVTLASLFAAAWRFWAQPGDRDIVIVTSVWAVLDLVLLTGALGALLERKQRRADPRLGVRRSFPLRIETGLGSREATLEDISAHGAGLRLAAGQHEGLRPGMPIVFALGARVLGEPCRLHAELRGISPAPESKEIRRAGLLFAPQSWLEKRQIVSLAFGSSSVLELNRIRHRARRGLRHALPFLIGTGFYHAWKHLALLARPVGRWLRHYYGMAGYFIPRPPKNSAPESSMPRLTLLFLAFCIALTTTPSALVVNARAEAARQTRIVSLETLTGVNHPIRSHGSEETTEVALPVPSRMEISGATLRLRFTNSIALINRSQLVVSLNGHNIAQFPLRGQQPEATARVELPAQLLRPGYNTLRFSTALHYAMECEDPTAPELWVEIDPHESTMELAASPQKLNPTLADLENLFDRRQWDMPSYTLMTLQGAPLDDTVRAVLALVAQGIGGWLDYQPPRLHHQPVIASRAGTAGRFPGLPSSAGQGMDSILIGTREQLTPLVAPGLRDRIQDAFMGIYPKDDDPTHFLLVISGTTPEEVRRAATAFALRRIAHAAHPETLIRNLELPSLPANNLRGRLKLQPGTKARLADFGFQTRTFTGIHTSPAELRVWTDTDPFVSHKDSVRLKLRLAYGAGLGAQSAMNIFLNDKFQRAIPLIDPAGGMIPDYQIDVPVSDFITGWNTLRFQAELVPAARGGKCEPMFVGNPKATLFEDSTLDMVGGGDPARLPDLALFAGAALPHGERPDGSRMALLLADNSNATLSAGLTLMAKLTQINKQPPLAVWFGTGTPPGDRHLIVLGEQNAVPEPLRARARANLAATVGERLGLTSQVREANWLQGIFGLPQRMVTPVSALATVEADFSDTMFVTVFESPSDPALEVVVLTALAADLLREGVFSLVGHTLWGQLKGNFALRREDSDTLRAGRLSASPFTEYGARKALGLWLADHPLVTIMLLTSLFLLFAHLVTRLLRRYREHHHPDVVDE